MSRATASFLPAEPGGGGGRLMRAGAWIGLAVVVLGSAVLWVRRPGTMVSRPVPMAEMARSNLVFLNGQLFLAGKPFNGLMVEHYPNGNYRSRSGISNGVLNGVSEGWYTNEVLQVSECFVNGISHGRRTQWDQEGRRISEARIVEGKIEGVFRRWHANGRVSEEVSMRRGEADGLSRAWYPSGFLKARVTLLKGKVSDRHAYPDGELEESPEPWEGAASR